MDFERDRASRRDDGATTVGFDVSAVVVRTARLLCAPRGEEAYRTLKALKWAVREIGLEAFKDDSRVSHVRESGLEELMTKLRENDPVKFCRLERATSETPREGDASDALKKLNHAYLWLPPSVRVDDGDTHALVYASADERIIIEPNLRSHFVVGRATAQYARLVESMPTAFVGTYAHLSEIVFFMSTHMINSFRESGLDIPPWRRPSALTSKWDRQIRRRRARLHFPERLPGRAVRFPQRRLARFQAFTNRSSRRIVRCSACSSSFAFVVSPSLRSPALQPPRRARHSMPT